MGPPMGGPDAPDEVAPGPEMTPRSGSTAASNGSPDTISGSHTASADSVERALSLRQRKRAASTWWSSSRGTSRLGGLLGRPM